MLSSTGGSCEAALLVFIPTCTAGDERAPTLRFVIPLQRACQAFCSLSLKGVVVSSPGMKEPNKMASGSEDSSFLCFLLGMVLVLGLPGVRHRFLFRAALLGLLHRARLRPALDGINPQHHPPAHLAGLQPVPFPDLLGGHAELVGNAAQGISLP